jgi:hypothetical protein
MRQYEPIWHQLKSLPEEQAKTVGIRITANRLMHARIIKAVTKEKYKDIGYKLRTEPRVAIMEHKRAGSVVTFTLRFKLGLQKNLRLKDF